MNRNSMKIRNKITGEVASGVVEVDNPCVGWEFRYKDGSCRITYYRTHWEPVEEWVKIEVCKRDVGRLPFMTSYVDGATLEWRYPQ